MVRPQAVRPTQAQRRARSRAALIEAAARGLSRHGYANLNLDEIAREAGYTRGALYHQFAGKEDLALAVLRWVDARWIAEVGDPARGADGPLGELFALARGHAVFCRRDIGRVALALRLEFSDPEHPIGRELERVGDGAVRRIARLITAGRRSGEIPAGPPARLTAEAVLGALEGAVIGIGGRYPYDEELAARAVAGVLGVGGPR